MKKYLFRNEGEWALRHLNLGREGKVAWDNFLRGLYDVFKWAFDGEIDIVSRDLSYLSRQLKELIAGRPVISIDPCIVGDINLGISRIFLPGGKIDIGINRRPGFVALSKQMMEVPNGKFILMEDDIFSGGTIQQVIDLLKKQKINIENVICGFRVGDSQLDTPLVALESYSSEEVIDLNDPRDFIAGANKGGLVVQYQDGSLVRVPYIFPFVDTAARSSVPQEKVLSFSRMVWGLNIEFWSNFPVVLLNEVEPFFCKMLERWGYIAEKRSMVSVSEDMLNLLTFPEIEIDIGNSKGVIFLDLNETLITNGKGELNVDDQILKEAIKNAKNIGWEIGLCSDSPHHDLYQWGKKYGITGPIIAENGRLFEGKVISAPNINVTKIKGLIRNWAGNNSITILPDISAVEFGGKQPNCSGVAFGAGRISSVSVFCFKEGDKDAILAMRLAEFLTDNSYEISVDCSPRDGFVAVHGGDDFRLTKGQILRGIGWSLYKHGKRCWMIGNSISDCTFSPAFCKVGVVGNATQEAKQIADVIAKASCTRGVIEIIDLITT